MRTLCLTLAYDGTDFHGWQVQPDRRTVQGEVTRVISMLLDEPVRVQGAGRTDRGVHARGQVASFTTEKALPAPVLARALEGLLPRDVMVRRVEEAPPGFHARFSALSRTYVYRISGRDDPFGRRGAWILPRRPDPARLRAAARPLLGRHDFSTFAAAGGDAPPEPACTVTGVKWLARGTALLFVIRSDRFLYRMVRTIVGTLVGLEREGRLDAGGVLGLLGERDRGRAGVAAPPQGLHLLRVTYPPPGRLDQTARVG